MITFLLRRLLRVLLTVWIGVSIVFFALRLVGDPAVQIAGIGASAAEVAQLRDYLELDRPIWQQYGSYIGNLASGDFGQSFKDGRAALQVIIERLPLTLLLGGMSFVLAFGTGVPLGVVAAYRQGSVIDRLLVGVSVFGYAVPNFFFGVLLLFFFSYKLQWFPSAGSGTPMHLVLPTVTLGLGWSGIVARLVRSSFLEARGAEYVTAAKARGLSTRQVFFHVARNAAVPTVLISGFVVGGMVSGAVVTETIFSWPGVGRALLSAVIDRDLPVVQAGVIVVIVAMTLANFLAGSIAAAIDPRLRTA